jgi:hypothetical protein
MLENWYSRHAGRPLTPEVLADLRATLGLLAFSGVSGGEPEKSEAWAQSAVRLEASELGFTLFRNNVGVLKDKNGRPVRFGLGNDSSRLNEIVKSADLIGIRPVKITPEHVGKTMGQFLSREIKEPGWRYTGAGRESAQLAWANLVNSLGGDAAFATGPGSFWPG